MSGEPVSPSVRSRREMDKRHAKQVGGRSDRLRCYHLRTAGGDDLVPHEFVEHRSGPVGLAEIRSEEHTSELQSLMRISYAVFCLKKKKTIKHTTTNAHTTAIVRIQ